MSSLEDLKKEASTFVFKSDKELEQKIESLANEGLGFLGCVAFIQSAKSIPLNEARDFAMSLSVFETDAKFQELHRYSISEYNEES